MPTSAPVNIGLSTRFKAGWIVLLVSAGLMTVNHLGLMFFLDDPILFLGWTAFNFYALLVIAIPFRRLERWAWYATWILPVGLAVPAIFDPGLLLFYSAFAGTCVLGLVLTMREFFAVDRRAASQVS